MDQQVKDDIHFLLSFCPKEKPEDLSIGLNPMSYHSLDYTKDLELLARLEDIRDRYEG